MAGAAGDTLKWPGPVTFNDDDPKRGFATVFLTIPDMTIKKALLGKAEPTNAVIKESFTKQQVAVTITVTQDGTQTVYEYSKGLPEDIDPDNSSYKVKKKQVILSLCKAESISWGAHAKYFVKK